MKDVPIKFRGKSAMGEVYGFYIEREGKPYIVNDAGGYVSVDSVQQLIGYDYKGVEVYEGDCVDKVTSYAVLEPCYKEFNTYSGKYEYRQFNAYSVQKYQLKVH